MSTYNSTTICQKQSDFEITIIFRQSQTALTSNNQLITSRHYGINMNISIKCTRSIMFLFLTASISVRQYLGYNNRVVRDKLLE